MADMKIAAYICKGCGLGERLDTAQLAKIATERRQGRRWCASTSSCATPKAWQMIRNDIDNEGVTHVMIAACSRRAKTEAFTFPMSRCRAPICAKA